MNEEMEQQLGTDLDDAAFTLDSALRYMDAWHDESLDGTLDAAKSDLEFKRQLLIQFISMNQTLEWIRAGLYAMAGITMLRSDEEPPA